MLDNMVMDGDIYVVKDVKGILFIKVGLENKTKTLKFKGQIKNGLLETFVQKHYGK